MSGRHAGIPAGGMTRTDWLAINEVLELVDKATVEGYDDGYRSGYEDGRRSIKWWEVVFYLSCAFAFLVCGAFWLGRYFQ